MEWIFENLFLIIVIISGIIGFFNQDSKDKNKKDNNKKKPFDIPKPTPTPSGGRKTNPEPTQTINRPKPTNLSVEEQQQEQLKRLASQLKTASSHQLENISNKSHRSFEQITDLQRETFSEKQRELKKQIGSNLGRKGLVQGIIMSEVLGPPRARKPYRSIIEERKIK